MLSYAFSVLPFFLAKKLLVDLVWSANLTSFEIENSKILATLEEP